MKGLLNITSNYQEDIVLAGITRAMDKIKASDVMIPLPVVEEEEE